MLLVCLTIALAIAQDAVINVPVADLRQFAQGRKVPITYQHDQAQLTQLLYFEPVKILTAGQEWTLVEAIQQPMIYNNTWSGYIGYVLTSQLTPFPPTETSISVVVPYGTIFSKSCQMDGCITSDALLEVSFGTWLAPIGEPVYGWQKIMTHTGKPGYIREKEVAPFVPNADEKTIRSIIPQRAQLLLGYLYSWGGRSAFSLDVFATRKQFTGLDCSGYSSILYRSCGVIIPRDAGKQALKVHNVTINNMQVGDLFFLGVANKVPVTHVMTLFSINPPLLVESADNSTRILPIEEVFGAPFKNLVWGEKLTKGMDSGAYLSWGSVFPLGR